MVWPLSSDNTGYSGYTYTIGICCTDDAPFWSFKLTLGVKRIDLSMIEVTVYVKIFTSLQVMAFAAIKLQKATVETGTVRWLNPIPVMWAQHHQFRYVLPSGVWVTHESFKRSAKEINIYKRIVSNSWLDSTFAWCSSDNAKAKSNNCFIIKFRIIFSSKHAFLDSPV